jgi:hypothetical protein
MAGNILLMALPAAERDRLRPFLEQTQMPQAEVLIQPDSPIRHIWFPVDAVTSTLQQLTNGDSVEAGLVGREGMIGIHLWLRQRTTPSKTLVQISGSGWTMDAEDFRREVMLKPASPLHDLIAAYIHGFLNMTSQTAACNRMHHIDQRLCRWLRIVYNRLREGGIYHSHRSSLHRCSACSDPRSPPLRTFCDEPGLLTTTEG